MFCSLWRHKRVESLPLHSITSVSGPCAATLAPHSHHPHPPIHPPTSSVKSTYLYVFLVLRIHYLLTYTCIHYALFYHSYTCTHTYIVCIQFHTHTHIRTYTYENRNNTVSIIVRFFLWLLLFVITTTYCKDYCYYNYYYYSSCLSLVVLR